MRDEGDAGDVSADASGDYMFIGGPGTSRTIQNRKELAGS